MQNKKWVYNCACVNVRARQCASCSQQRFIGVQVQTRFDVSKEDLVAAQQAYAADPDVLEEMQHLRRLYFGDQPAFDENDIPQGMTAEKVRTLLRRGTEPACINRLSSATFSLHRLHSSTSCSLVMWRLSMRLSTMLPSRHAATLLRVKNA
jgi:hypothetical protein